MMELLCPDRALLLVIDIQEKFKPILFNPDQVVRGTHQMIAGCNQLDVPIIVSEQYPKGLGATVPEIKETLKPSTPILEKTSFGCLDEPAIQERLSHFGRNQILICGVEAHVCVNQTVMRLLETGYRVYLIEDAIGSRSENNYHIALRKMTQAGAIPSCMEMALFELMRSSRHPQFRSVQQIIL